MEELNREEVYSFSYTNREDGKQVSTVFHPIGDTWNDILPEFRRFLQGVGFEFSPSQVLDFVNTEDCNEPVITSVSIKQERDLAGHYLDGYSSGFQEAVALIRKNVIQQLTLQDAQILDNYLKAMTPL